MYIQVLRGNIPSLWHIMQHTFPSLLHKCCVIRWKSYCPTIMSQQSFLLVVENKSATEHVWTWISIFCSNVALKRNQHPFANNCIYLTVKNIVFVSKRRREYSGQISVTSAMIRVIVLCSGQDITLTVPFPNCQSLIYQGNLPRGVSAILQVTLIDMETRISSGTRPILIA